MPGRFSGVLLPDRFSFQRLSPMFQSDKACRAEVFPELFGPKKTTGLPSSISTLPKRLKFRIVSLVNIRWIHFTNKCAVVDQVSGVRQRPRPHYALLVAAHRFPMEVASSIRSGVHH